MTGVTYELTGERFGRLVVIGNYEPGNCRWATHKQQANNQRRSYRNRQKKEEGQ